MAWPNNNFSSNHNFSLLQNCQGISFLQNQQNFRDNDELFRRGNELCSVGNSEIERLQAQLGQLRVDREDERLLDELLEQPDILEQLLEEKGEDTSTSYYNFDRSSKGVYNNDPNNSNGSYSNNQYDSASNSSSTIRKAPLRAKNDLLAHSKSQGYLPSVADSKNTYVSSTNSRTDRSNFYSDSNPDGTESKHSSDLATVSTITGTRFEYTGARRSERRTGMAHRFTDELDEEGILDMKRIFGGANMKAIDYLKEHQERRHRAKMKKIHDKREKEILAELIRVVN